MAAGDDALHHLRVGAEGRRTLARVEHAEAAGCAGADVEQAAAASERRLGELDGARDLLALGRDGVGNGAIFGVYEIDDLEGDARSIAAVRGLRRSVSRGSDIQCVAER